MHRPMKGPVTYRADSEKFRFVRSKMGMTEEAFAVACGVGKGTIGNIESGTERQTAKTFKAIFEKISQGTIKDEFGCTSWHDLLIEEDRLQLLNPSSERSSTASTPIVTPPPRPREPNDPTNGPQHTVEAGSVVAMSELGPFLREYARMIALDTSVVIDGFRNWKGRREDQWPFHELGGNEDACRFFEEDLYKGLSSDRVAFHQLQRLIAAFNDPTDENDVPTLMAEWLCAVRKGADHIHLKLGEFTSPPEVSGKRATFGVSTTYLNAPVRLSGMECAFVRFELAGNLTPEGTRPAIAKVTELLQHLGDEDATKAIPQSRLHVHPGDEIVFVTEGTVFVQLENTGIWTPVQKGDFVHFNAEIPHAVWNLYPERATAVIIRFFQLKRHGTRFRQIDILRRISLLMGRLNEEYAPASTNRIGLLDYLKLGLPKWIQDTKHTYRLWTEIAPWVHDRTRRPKDRLRKVNSLTPVQDLVGLSRFLLTYIQCQPDDEMSLRPGLAELRSAIREVEELSHSDPETESAAGFQQILRFKDRLRDFLQANFAESDIATIRCCFEGVPSLNDAAPTSETLGKISSVLKMPRVLLDGYLSPNALRVVAVRGGAARNGLKTLDWIEPTQGARGEDASKVDYLIPSRALANSDVSHVLLELDPGGRTAWNYHPGFETLIPIYGRVRVELHPLGAEVTQSDIGDSTSVIIYRSSVSHRVINAGDEKARVLVMRFNIQPD